MEKSKFTKNDLFKANLKKIEEGKRLTKSEMAYQIGNKSTYNPYSLYSEAFKRDEIVKYFNFLFNVNTK